MTYMKQFHAEHLFIYIQIIFMEHFCFKIFSRQRLSHKIVANKLKPFFIEVETLTKISLIQIKGRILKHCFYSLWL